MKKETTENYNVYFKSPSSTELIESFKTKDKAIQKADMPGMYYSRLLSNDADACIEVTNTKTGELVYYTLTAAEQETNPKAIIGSGVEELVLENYELSPRTVRIKGEDVYLFIVENSTDHKRTKKDADNIGKRIVEAVNNYQALKDSNAELLKVLQYIKDDADKFNDGIVKKGGCVYKMIAEAINKATEEIQVGDTVTNGNETFIVHKIENDRVYCDEKCFYHKSAINKAKSI